MVTTVSDNKNFELTVQRSNGVASVAASCIFFFLGAIFIVATIALWIIEALEGRSFHRLEVCLPVASFFLFIAGAHFMDRRDARRAKERE